MTERSKLHVPEQGAYALLGPVRRQLAELEQRTDHHLTRLTLPPSDAEALEHAHDALSAAHAAVARLWQESAPR